MPAYPPAQRRRLSALAIIAIASLAWPSMTHAQNAMPTLVLRPHCEQIDQTLCKYFEVADPSTLITPPVKTGDKLDLDVVLINPTQEKIANVRLWISYDADALEGTALVISTVFPTLTPGQTDFAPLSGYAKIAAAAVTGNEPVDAILPVARLTFSIKNAQKSAPTPLSFYDQRAGIEGHTYVSTATAPTQNLLSAPLGALLVQLVGSPVAAQGPSAATSPTTAGNPYAAQGSSPATSPTGVAASSTAAATSDSSTITSPSNSLAPPVGTLGTSSASTQASDARSVASASSVQPSSRPSVPPIPLTTAPDVPDNAGTFGLIQMQNVRISTKENALYVMWDSLSYPKLQGYNVYYGTLRGRYLNRHGVSVASRGTVIRDLPVGKTYYVAVRGVDDQNHETSFSTETSVEIGNPATSSSPIVGSLDLVSETAPSSKAPQNPVGRLRENVSDGSVKPDVTGKSGAPSGIVLLILGSAAIGTLLACRRQMLASRRLPL